MTSLNDRLTTLAREFPTMRTQTALDLLNNPGVTLYQVADLVADDTSMTLAQAKKIHKIVTDAPDTPIDIAERAWAANPGRAFQAIKDVRATLNCSLVQAKDLVDIARGLNRPEDVRWDL